MLKSLSLRRSKQRSRIMAKDFAVQGASHHQPFNMGVRPTILILQSPFILLSGQIQLAHKSVRDFTGKICSLVIKFPFFKT